MNMLKQFLIGDILKKVETKKISLKKGDCSSFYTEKYNLPARTATTQNQGLSCFVPKDMATVLRNKISVSANGDFCAFWHDTDFTILQDSYALEGNGFELNEKRALYIISSMYRALGKKYNWNNKSGWEKIKKEFISLPIHNISCVDFNRIQDIVVRGVDVDMTKIDTSTWKEFKLSELFIITTTRAIDRKNVEFCDDGEYDFIGRTCVNYGIQGLVHNLGYEPNPANTFSLVQIGETCCLYREKAWYASQNIFMLKPKYKEICDFQLFITTVINKKLEPYKEAYTYPTLRVLNDLSILLPVKEKEEIDFKYMEKYIAELEGQRIAELEGYLMATGLNDYELTEDEKQILSISKKSVCNRKLDFGEFVLNAKQMKKFKCEKLFFSQTGDVDLQQKDINGKGCYFINSGVENMGIKGKTDKKAKIFPINTITIDFWGNAYYRDFNYKMATHNHVFSLSGDVIKNRYVGLYIVAKMGYMKKLFSYSNMGTWKKIKDLDIELPVQEDKDIECKYHKDGYIPDFEYMEKYIRIMEKLVIKDVVKYKDLEIEKIKEILSIV